jgi:hypothetical protein
VLPAACGVWSWGSPDSAPEQGERLAKAAAGPSKIVIYPEGNQACFNISYKFRPLTADWMAKQLRASAG